MTQDCQRTLRNPPLQHHQGVPLYFFKQVELKKQKQNQKQNYAGVVLSQNVVTASILLIAIISSALLLDVLHFILSLSGGNLFEDWEATMASLQNESNCWVYSEILLLSSSGCP